MRYELHVWFYLNNSGMADNGYYDKMFSYPTLEKARSDAAKIQCCIDGTVSEDRKRAIEYDFIGYSGRFTKSPRIYKITRKLIALEKPLSDQGSGGARKTLEAVEQINSAI